MDDDFDFDSTLIWTTMTKKKFYQIINVREDLDDDNDNGQLLGQSCLTNSH